MTAPASGQRVDLKKHCPLDANPYWGAVAYALTYVCVDEPMRVTLRSGSSDGAKVWVNDAVVGDWIGCRQGIPCEYQMPVKLHAGSNKLLLKIVYRCKEWCFWLSTVDDKGLPARVTWTTNPSAGTIR